MGTNEVFAISNKPGEVTLKGFNYIKESKAKIDIKGLETESVKKER